MYEQIANFCVSSLPILDYFSQMNIGNFCTCFAIHGKKEYQIDNQLHRYNCFWYEKSSWLISSLFQSLKPHLFCIRTSFFCWPCRLFKMASQTESVEEVWLIILTLHHILLFLDIISCFTYRNIKVLIAFLW